ncbi:MAG: hypothetical protein VW452_04750, partial [Pelagibacteraceae bacterium]
IQTLKKMGGNIKIVNKRKINYETVADVIVKQTKHLKATKLRESDIPMQVDEIPILSIAASYAKGTTIFKGLKELTVKESNRLLLVQQNLIKMGVNAEIRNDYDLYIHGSHDPKKGGATIIHHHDHRIVMSFYIANLICLQNNKIDDKSSVKTSYPKFFKDFKGLSN